LIEKTLDYGFLNRHAFSGLVENRLPNFYYFGKWVGGGS